MDLLIFLDEPFKLLTPEAINICIWAQWSYPETQPLLFETVRNVWSMVLAGLRIPVLPVWWM